MHVDGDMFDSLTCIKDKEELFMLLQHQLELIPTASKFERIVVSKERLELSKTSCDASDDAGADAVDDDSLVIQQVDKKLFKRENMVHNGTCALQVMSKQSGTFSVRHFHLIGLIVVLMFRHRYGCFGSGVRRLTAQFSGR